MDESAFWQSIEETSRRAADGYPEVDLLQRLLEKQTPDEVLSWGEHFWHAMRISFTENLWGAAYIICGGAGRDGFDEFRAALILLGRKVFYQALENPDSLVEVLDDDIGCESALTLAGTTYFKITGGDEIPFSHHEYPEMNEDLDFENVADMTAMFPRLMAKFRLD